MDVYYVTYCRLEAKITDQRVFKTLQELEDWLQRQKELEQIIIIDIIADSRCMG